MSASGQEKSITGPLRTSEQLRGPREVGLDEVRRSFSPDSAVPTGSLSTGTAAAFRCARAGYGSVLSTGDIAFLVG